MVFVGDIHGDIENWISLIRDVPSSVQVGDFGIGFLDSRETTTARAYLGPNHRFIRGNHDNLSLCEKTPGFIPDGTVEDGVMYVGGAWSVDQEFRVEGRDWWADEEVSYADANRIADRYAAVRPHTMVTHDGPDSITSAMFGPHRQTRTGAMLDRLLAIHAPKLWVFGHWHENSVLFDNGTVFRCIASNERWMNGQTIIAC